MSVGAPAAPGSARARTGAREPTASWRRTDRIALGLCWAAGIALCVAAAAILLYMAVRGMQFLRPELILERPTGDVEQTRSGGILDPILGTVLLTALSTAIALPLALAVAFWLTEYGRPAILARAVESGVEIVAGTPSIVLAIFGLTFFSQAIFAPLSFESEGGGVFGRSFVIAAIMMSFIALPLIVGATREALQAVPGHVREASYALGKTKVATSRRVLLPAVRPAVATGTALGMGRIAGDTAIVIILLGNTLLIEPEGAVPIVDVLTGTGSTLTSYVYENSPAGEGGAFEKAYAAAFVLLLVVLALNFLVARLAGGAALARSAQWGR